MAEEDGSGSNNLPCGDFPKSTVSESCVPLQLFEDVQKLETIRGRCVVLPSTNPQNGRVECIPFVTGMNCSSVAPPLVVAADDEEEEEAQNPDRFELSRKLFAELLGTALLVFIVVGSGIAGDTYSPDVGVALTMNAAATFAGLYGLILVLGPVSGAHFNPIVSFVDVMFGAMHPSVLPSYAVAQTTGAILGALVANFTYDIDFAFSTKPRRSLNLWVSEVLGTATLLLIIHGCLRTGNGQTIPFAVAAWVGGGYFTFSSTIFANPAVTVGRMFSNTFAGIAPSSAWIYIFFQVIGGILGYGTINVLYPKRK